VEASLTKIENHQFGALIIFYNHTTMFLSLSQWH